MARRQALWRSVSANEREYAPPGSILGPYCSDAECSLYRVTGYVGLHEGPLGA